MAKKTGAAAAASPTPISTLPSAPKHHSRAARTLLRPAKWGARCGPFEKVGHSVPVCFSHRR